MSNFTEGPNPLRPYYKPSSVGLPVDAGIHPSSAHVISKHAPSTAKTSFGSSARDILSDLDYSDYLSDTGPSAGEAIKHFLDQALWKYSSVLFAQPFEIAKVVLQVQLASTVEGGSRQLAINDEIRRKPEKYRYDDYEVPSDDSDPDSPSYFISSAPVSRTPPSRSPRRGRRGRHQHNEYSRSPPPNTQSSHPSSDPTAFTHTRHLSSRSSITTAISHLRATEGAWGIWKGTNSTFIHSILLSTITSFARSLLCAVLALPDPDISFPQSQPAYLIPIPSVIGGLDILSSPSPLASLAAAVGAAGIAGMLLAPLDIARTKLMLTSSTYLPRSLLPTLQSLPSWTLPFSIAPVTILHSTIPTLISASTPLLLRARLGVDPVLTPNMYSLATFLSQSLELFIRLPLETVLRRGQITVSTSPSSDTQALPLHNSPPGTQLHTIVEVGPYQGLAGTMYQIVFEEGWRNSETAPEMIGGRNGAALVLKVGPTGMTPVTGAKKKKGQGLEGLWRGWRVGMWGLVGVWGAAAVGSGGGKGGEF